MRTTREITWLDGKYHWEGLASGCGYNDYCSEDGWSTPEKAQADCLYCLYRINGPDHDEAMGELYNYNHFTDSVLEQCDQENKDRPSLESE